MDDKTKAVVIAIGVAIAVIAFLAWLAYASGPTP